MTSDSPAAAFTFSHRRGRSRAIDAFLRNRFAIAGLAVLVLIVVAGIAAPVLAPHDPADQELRSRLAGLSRAHPLGTDIFGRDVLSRLLFASWVSMRAAGQATLTAIFLGVPLGLLAGFLGRWIDAVLSRVCDALMSLPGIIFALSVIAALGPGLSNAMFALGIVGAPILFRVARSAARSVKNQNYIDGARALGCSTTRLLLRHVLPNAIAPLLVQVTFSFSTSILGEASLSFLGFGARPPTASWGTMIRDAFQTISQTTTPFFPPAAMILVTVVSLSAVGDGMRDALAGKDRS